MVAKWFRTSLAAVARCATCPTARLTGARGTTGANSRGPSCRRSPRDCCASGVRTGRSRPRRDVACLLFERPDRRQWGRGARRERSGRGDRASASPRRISADPRTDVAPGIPEAAICVQDVDVQCVLQFTLIHAAGCALHRRTSRVIHRLELSLRTTFDWRVRRAAPQRGPGRSRAVFRHGVPADLR